jgi:hypothetical protein
LFQGRSSGDTGRGGPGSVDPSGITPDVLRAFLAAVATGRSGTSDDLDEDDEDYDPEQDDDDQDVWFYPTRTQSWVPPVTTEPQEPGSKLLNSGEFGYIGPKRRARPNHTNVVRAILNAASKPASTYVPTEETTTVCYLTIS